MNTLVLFTLLAQTAAPAEPSAVTQFLDGFQFGSYGRVGVGTDLTGRLGRPVNLVAHGPRLIEEGYAELELRREDTFGPVKSRVVEYSAPPAAKGGRRALTAVCLTDVLDDGLSMVYSFYDPDLAKDSLGTYVILDHIEIAREAGLPYVYLGYWVPGSPKMGYKATYRPQERLGADGLWTAVDEA